MSLFLVPVEFADACGFVTMWHRHLGPPVGMKFCVGVADEARVLRGVAIVGRPVARSYDNGLTLEVTRCATDGTPNTASMLYAACWRATKAIGYRRLITMTHTDGESGASLRAAGYRVVAELRAVLDEARAAGLVERQRDRERKLRARERERKERAS